VLTITRRTTFDADTKLRAQIADAADGVCRYITEALATDRDREFARFVRLARGSLRDLQDGLRAALLKRAFAERDVRDIRELLSRLHPALTALLWRQPGTPRTDFEASSR
jgi:four helix bundle protein